MQYSLVNRQLSIGITAAILVLFSNTSAAQSGDCIVTSFPDQWQVHNLQSSQLPFRSVYILPQEDLDGDGLKDIVAGAWWYRNPGSASGNWQRKTIGNPFQNVAYLHDFDNDGDIDLLGTQGDYIGAEMAWAQNDGSGNFTVRTNIPSGRTTYWEKKIQGIAGGIFQSGGPYQIAINWNGAESSGSTVQMLTVPNDPVNSTWSLDDISPDSLGEEILSADIDKDGDLDLFQSSNWLRNNGNGTWTTIYTGIDYVTNPDRTQLADFDGDGDLDAVVGQLGIGTIASARKEFAWFEAPSDPTGTWTKHILATDISSSLSLGVSDIDFDGDIDITVGEWKDAKRLITFENDLCSSGTWIRHTIDSGGNGFDHHDGAQIVDIDNDGDLDIVSIGWDNIVPRVFENMSSVSNILPVVSAGDDQSITLPIDTSILNGSGSDPDGGSVSYEWTQRNGPNIANLANADTAELRADDLVEGGYVFRLTVTDNEGDSEFDDVNLTVFPEIVVALAAQAEATPLTGTAPFEVSFTGSNSTGEITSYLWDFKDGETFGEADPTHTFAAPGSYEVELTVTDGGGETNSDTVTITVLEPAVELSAVAEATPLTGSSPLEVSFTGSSSTGEITSYLWDFKDGGTSGEADPTHTFSAPGSYEVELTVTDDGGETNSDTVTITVLEPVVELLAVAEATLLTGTAPLEVTFTGNNSTGEITSYLWDFKDGETSGEADTAHTFSAPGSYEVELTVTDGGGETNSNTVTVTVLEPAVELSAMAEATLLTGTAPLEVSFTGSSSTGEITSYLWDFKDGETSGEADTTHTFAVPDSYEVELTVTDGGGITDSDTVTITVLEPAVELSAMAEATLLTGTAPLEVSFTGSSSTGEITSYLWDFKDGETSGEAGTTHTFAAPGSYEVELTVTDDGGETNSDTVTITVLEPAVELSAVAEATPLTGTAPLEVSFTGSSSTGEITSYLWDFKDGETSGEAGTTHTFAAPGSYEVELTVTDGGGGTNSDTVTITVLEPAVELSAVAEATPLTGTAPLEVSFAGSSSTGGITSYLWDFKDGNTSDEADVVHTFTDSGTYEVVLTVTDDSGAIRSASVKIAVTDMNDGETMAVILESNPSKNGIASIRVMNRPDDFIIATINLHDQHGRLIGSFIPGEVGVGNTYQIPVHTLRDGLYYFHLEIENSEDAILKLLLKNTP